jgi:hypothetical protein
MLVIVGIECLMIDSATIVSESTQKVQATSSAWFQEPPRMVQVKTNKVIRPPEWIPWSLIASGSVIILYALTLRNRGGGD